MFSTNFVGGDLTIFIFSGTWSGFEEIFDNSSFDAFGIGFKYNSDVDNVILSDFIGSMIIVSTVCFSTKGVNDGFVMVLFFDVFDKFIEDLKAESDVFEEFGFKLKDDFDGDFRGYFNKDDNDEFDGDFFNCSDGFFTMKLVLDIGVFDIGFMYDFDVKIVALSDFIGFKVIVFTAWFSKKYVVDGFAMVTFFEVFDKFNKGFKSDFGEFCFELNDNFDGDFSGYFNKGDNNEFDGDFSIDFDGFSLS